MSRSATLPEGRYLSCANRVPPNAGGQTRALLLRNRILAEHGGVRPDVLTFAAVADHAGHGDILRERGLLADGVGLLNLHHFYREGGWGDAPPTGETLPDLSRHRIGEQALPDGTPWRITYRLPDGNRMCDYLRADGSPYVRMPLRSMNKPAGWRAPMTQVGPGGQIIGDITTVGQWVRTWIRALAAGHDRAFVFTDSRYVAPHLVHVRSRRIHFLYQMHNTHVLRPFRWDSEMPGPYKRVLRRIDDMDAIVTLTERQREDIAKRRGRTSNMFVVPNPVRLPPASVAPPSRDPGLVTIVARLEPQKNLKDAVAAFERVVATMPTARLEIYGEGTLRPSLEREIERRGLSGSVVLRGFDPHAAERLWNSSAFLMTSHYEGYPLSTLESMSRGCPVVSYDVTYGPREQITDGVDGCLVPAGDVDGIATRLLELLGSPERVRRMSEAARRKAAEHGEDQFLTGWAAVIDAVVEQEPFRTKLEEVTLDLRRLEVARPGLLGGLAGRLPDLWFDASLDVRGRGARSGLEAAQVALDTIDDATGEVTGVPLEVVRSGRTFRLSAHTDATRLEGAWLRLRLTWVNSTWETTLSASPPVRRTRRHRRASGHARA